MGSVRLSAAVAALALLGSAAPASAATPRFIGTGHDPSVAVDANGTAHVAWPSEQNGATLEYCQLPRKAKACSVRQSFPMDEIGSGHPQVLLPARPGAVSIVMPLGSDPALLLNSADGGVTFAGVRLGEINTLEEAVYGPGDTLTLVTGSGPAAIARYGFDGAGPPDPIVSFGSATEALDTSITTHEGRLAVFYAGSGRLRQFQWNGLGDPNAPESWVEGQSLGEGRYSPSAVTGPSGTHVAFVHRGAGRSDTYVRRLRGDRYDRPRRVSRQDPVELAFAQGPKGNMALLWPSSEDAWIVRSRTGRRWTKPRRLFKGRDPSDLRASLGPRGGWMVWDSSAGNAGSHPIRIVAVPGAPRR